MHYLIYSSKQSDEIDIIFLFPIFQMRKLKLSHSEEVIGSKSQLISFRWEIHAHFLWDQRLLADRWLM